MAGACGRRFGARGRLPPLYYKESGAKMKFTELDSRMRVFETASDLCVLPGIYMVARIDGRHFHTLTKDGGKFEAPFDENSAI